MNVSTVSGLGLVRQTSTWTIGTQMLTTEMTQKLKVSSLYGVSKGKCISFLPAPCLCFACFACVVASLGAGKEQGLPLSKIPKRAGLDLHLAKYVFLKQGVSLEA